MINAQEIKHQHRQICQALADKRIKDSLDHILNLVKTSHDGDLIDAQYNLEFTYKNILKYTVEGISDPERQTVYNHLIKDVYSLADKTADTLLSKYGSGELFDLRRDLKDNTLSQGIDDYISTLAGVELKKMVDPAAENDEELQNLRLVIFQLIWIKPSHVATDMDQLKSLFKNQQVPWYDKAMFVSALTLSLTHCFSTEYIQLLMDLVKHPHEQVNARAATGLLLALFKYDARLSLYPDLFTRFFLLLEEKGMQTLIQSITIQLIRTRETERISQKLNDEILPEVVKMHPKLKDKLDLENLLGEGMHEDKNPEWEDFFKDSPTLMSKLEELTQWQLEGADVFLSTFKMLKHFSFFNQIPNWLIPFYPSHPAVNKALEHEDDVFKNTSLLESLSESRFLCNSDKFSLILSVPHMPAMQKDLMGQMFSAELQQMADIEKDEKALQAHQQKLVISNQFIQDLYRLLRVHPYKHQFEDFFNQRMDFHNKWFFKQSLADHSSLREIGEYYFKKNYFEDALEIFHLIHSKQPGSKEIIQKIAYAHQHLENYESALNFYLQADLIDAQSTWIKKKIALCYHHLKNMDKALQFYKEAESLAPDNLHTQASIGHCLLEVKDFEQALKYYFKVEYLDPAHKKAWRPIAWCSFILGKFDQAEKYYHKLLVAEKNKHDLMNLGHVLWCKKDRKEALSYYQKSIRQPDHSIEEFMETFNEDITYLKAQGIDSADIPIMLDQVRYALEN